MKPLIQAAEIWVPDAEASLLEFGGGLYDSAVEFGAISRSMCFGCTEGLPGRVWDEGRPILLTDLQSGYFRRAAAARKAGLVCALAFPTYLAERLQAVVVLYCGGPQADAGAVELWRNDPRVTTDMTLVEGYYGATVPDFAAATRETYLPRGVGLPGLAWQRQASVFVDGLGDTPKFVRSEAAGAAGIQCGLALPCPVPGLSNYVLALLGSRTMPVARRVECWAMASGEGFGLQRLYGHDEQDGALPTGEQAITGGDFADGVASVLANAGPRVLKPFGEMSRGCLILPIASDGLVAEAVALHF